MEKKTRWELRKNASSYYEQTLEATPHEETGVQSRNSDLKNYPRKTN